MNLVQQANFLEDVPKDQLVSMSQDPNAQFPAFLVLSEIQRRTTNEKNYQAMVNQPTTTVAEEVVSDFAQPTGLQGGAPQATPLPTNISAGLSGAPTAPMQMAASGGLTGYATGDITSLPAGSAPTFGSGLGMDALGESLEDTYESTKKALADRYMDADGTINWSRVGADGLSAGLVASYFTPVGAIRGGLGLLGRGIGSVGKLFSSAGREGVKKSLGRNVAKINPKMVRDPKTGQFRSQAEIGGAAISSVAKPIAIGSGITYLQSDGEETITEEEIETLEEMEARIRKEEQEKYQKQLNELKGLAGAKETESRGDYRDLVRLGAGIMSAKNVGDIGTAVTGILDAQDKRELLGLQGKFTQAQTEQIQAKIESMELEQLQATASILYKGISDGSLDRETNEPLLQQYLEQIQKLQNVELLGSKALSDAEQKILEQSKAIV